LATVLARISSAFVDVGFAIYTAESSWAFASVHVDAVNTDTFVLARLRCTLINVGFTIVS
jgi:hypothetical protein